MNAEKFTNFIGILIEQYEWAIYTAIIITVVALMSVLYKIMQESIKNEENKKDKK